MQELNLKDIKKKKLDEIVKMYLTKTPFKILEGLANSVRVFNIHVNVHEPAEVQEAKDVFWAHLEAYRLKMISNSFAIKERIKQSKGGGADEKII